MRPASRFRTPSPKPPPIRPREGMSASHLAKIRLCPCLSCGHEPAGTANHLMHAEHGSNGRGLNRKQADQWAVPACPTCHQAVTDVADDEAWYAALGIQARDVAMALWTIRSKVVEHYATVILAHRARAALKLRLART